MIHSLPRLLRNGTFRTAAACALALLLAAAVPEAFSLESPSFAQTGGSEDNRTNQDQGEESGGSEGSEYAKNVSKNEGLPKIDDSQLILSGLVLAFLAIFMLTIRHIFKRHIHKQSGTIERITIVVILVMGSLFLISTGFGGTHIAPAFGLFGMIGGYLLGQISPRKQGGCSCEKCKNESGDQQ